MKIGPLFKWFGSKWQSAKHYPAPEHGCIVEPYAGGAGYALNHADKTVLIYDIDPHLQVLWPWLINEATPERIQEIPLNLPEGTDIRKLGLSIGQATLLKSWQRTNSVGNCWTVSAWGSKPGQWTANTRARLCDEIGAVKHWSFCPVWSLLPIKGITWFVDPPYQYNYKYVKDLPAEFYLELAERVRSIPSGSQAIVCEAVCSKTGAAPNWLPFRPSHRSVTSRRKETQSHHSKELIWTNAST